MIGEQIVADAVAPRPPKHLVAVEAEVIARGLQVPPVAQLECGVEMTVRAGADQIDGVMINDRIAGMRRNRPSSRTRGNRARRNRTW